MEWPTVTLERDDGKTLVLQGTQHFGPQRLYEQIRKDILRAKARDWVFFYEGIGKPNIPDSASEDVREVGLALALLFQVQKYVAAATSRALEREAMMDIDRLGVNADVTFLELAEELAKRGFGGGAVSIVCRQATELDRRLQEPVLKATALCIVALNYARGGSRFLLRPVPHGWRKRLRRHHKSRGNGRITDTRIDQIPSLVAADVASVKDVLLDWRNERAVEIIERHLKLHTVSGGYVVYGRAHISGLVSLLETRGWTVVEHTALDTADFA